VARVTGDRVPLPLNVRHIVYGLRGIRPPHGYWTLAALAAVNITAVAVIGQVWLMNFALLAVSALIVLPAVWAVLAFALMVLSTGPLAGPPDEFSGAYLIFSVAWRSMTQFVLLWLVAAYRQLDAAPALVPRSGGGARPSAYSGRAASRTGSCPGGHRRMFQPRVGVGDADASSAANELKVLVEESRPALADARRLITSY
jgi:hypothetical protein